MSPQLKSLNELIAQARGRIRARRVFRGTAATLGVIGATVIISAMVADAFSQKTGLIIALRFLPVVAGLFAALLFIARPLKAQIADARIARLIEERCVLSDRLVTAVEYSKENRDASPDIVNRLVADTGERCAKVDPDRIVDPRYAYGYAAISGLIVLGLIGAFFVGPSSLSKGMSALYSPFGETVSANAMFITVSPATSRVPRGSDQKLKATLNGFESETAQVFIRRLDAENWKATVMEPARNYGEFQHMIFNIQDSVVYYVESNGVRSPEVTLEVADLPFVKQIDLVLNFPSYTRMASKKIENGGEVAALKGTVVTVIARLSAQAQTAHIVLNDGTKIEMAEGDDDQFSGQFTVKQNGTYRIELTSEGGERYNGSNEYDITVIDDHAPTVVIDKPGRDMKVTSIQEVFTQARAEDDYGVSAIELYYSVNGGQEQRVQLQDLKSDTPRALSGAHTFFLEEHGLQPGDFISYYAKARDNNGGEATSDIYFLEVRPFDRQFRQAQQQGEGGGGEPDSNALTRRQREIIAATFRVQREESSYNPQEKAENFDAVTLSQEKLKGETEALAERIRRRLGEQVNAQPEFAKLIEYLGQAAKEMEQATGELKSRKTKEAMAPEQRALQQLLRAEAQFREMQISQSQSGEGGGQNEQELADLFELQLDKMKNQYETVQRQQQQNQSQQQDELARRLQELARRQQQQIEQQMRSQQQGGGGGGQSARQQQQMVDEARKMARELERLSRERRDPKMAESARQMQQAADDLQRAQSSSSNSAEATAQQMRALERMEQARRSLESAQRSGNGQSVERLRQQAEEALKRQEEISRKVDDLARQGQQGQQGQAGGPSEEQKQQLSERKQALADQIAGLEKDIDQAARGMGQNNQQAGDKLREAAGAIRRNRIPDRIRQNSQLIDNGWYDQARDRERAIKGNIEEVVKNLQSAENGASRAGNGDKSGKGDSMEDALNRARELADNLESLRRRMESQNNQGQSAQGNQQQGQQQGQQSQEGQQQGQASNNQGQQQGQQANGQQQGRQGQQGKNQQGQQANGKQQGGQQSGRQQGKGQQGKGQQGKGQQSGQQANGQQSGGQQSGNQQAQGQQGKGQQGQQQGQGQGQGQGQQQGEGQQQGQGQQANGQQGGSRQGSESPYGEASESASGGGPPRGGSRQLDSELRERIKEAEELRRALGRNSDLARDLNRAIENLKRLSPNVFSDPNQLALLKNEVIDPLRQLELELARRLQAKLGNNGPGALSDGDAPDRYRKLIEDYYRRLSSRSQK